MKRSSTSRPVQSITSHDLREVTGGIIVVGGRSALASYQLQSSVIPNAIVIGSMPLR